MKSWHHIWNNKWTMQSKEKKIKYCTSFEGNEGEPDSYESHGEQI